MKSRVLAVPRSSTLPLLHPMTSLVMLFLLSACRGGTQDTVAGDATTAPSICAPTTPVSQSNPTAGLIGIPGGTTQLGSTDFGPEEAPIREVTVEPFQMDATEVTNSQFAAFVAATGYVTVAERLGGGAVFTLPDNPPDMRDMSQWWRIDPEATWRTPGGRGTTALSHHPVVQVTLEDAKAYAKWAGRDLPTEAEWEHAARGGIKGAKYTWGDEPQKSSSAANHWQGSFPISDRGDDGFIGTAPVGCFPENGYGLHDMAGNVWELTTSIWDRKGSAPGSSVIKGGSWLCADNYCMRYRPAARQPADPQMPTNHIGFRTVRRQQGS